MQDLLTKLYDNLQCGRALDEGFRAADWKRLLERYSHFLDQRDAEGYIIDSQVAITSLRTPRPCLHLMASSHSRSRGVWGSFWDQFGGGFSCLESVLAGKMTSHLDTNYVPTAPELQDCRRFYIHESGAAWPMFPTPGYEESSYENFSCRQGLDTQVITAERAGLTCKLTVCVHPELPAEIYGIHIENRSDRPREFSWFSALRVNVDSFPFYYFVPRVVCEGLFEEESLVFLNHDGNNKHPRQAFFCAAPTFDRYDMMGEVFDGISARAPIPQAVQEGKCHNSLGTQPYAGLVAAAQFNVRLEPGQSQQWCCSYGSCPYPPDARAEHLRAVRNELSRGTQNIMSRVQERWTTAVQSCMINTTSADLDRYFNIWSRYQSRNQARFCRALDKMGYRDVMQDLLGVCDCDADYVRAVLLEALQYQCPDGRAVRQYDRFQPGGHDMRMYMDSSSWIPDLLVTYLTESGDFAVLDEEVPFFDETSRGPDPTNTATVYEHALLAVRSLFNSTGYHGLCRIGYGDWNDALSGIGGEKGVSVWLSCASVYAAGLMEKLAAHLGRREDEDEMRTIVATMTDRINAHAWDGQWYIYAINDQGHPIGSSRSDEGKIHLNVNTWALFTGVAQAAGREEQVWEALTQLETPVGHRLLAPPYTSKSRAEVGRIADQVPGMFENGSIYTHGESFYLYALIKSGKADACYRQLMRTLPVTLPQDLTSGPRQQQSNFSVGPDHPNYGMQLFSGFSGSVAWYRKVIQEMLGVKVGFDSLVIEPCVPAEWNEYELRKVWRGIKLRISMRRSQKHRLRIVLNGQEVTGPIPTASLATDTENRIDVEFA